MGNPMANIPEGTGEDIELVVVFTKISPCELVELVVQENGMRFLLVYLD